MANMCSVAQNLKRLGKAEAVYEFVRDNIITPSQGAEKLNISVRKLKADMIKAGYKYPEK